MQRSNYRSASTQAHATLTVAADTIAAGNSNQPGARFIHSLYAANRNAAARYLWVSLASAGGAVFAGCVFIIPAGGSIFIGSKELGDGGLATGGNTVLYLACSTSSSSYSGGTDADHDITVYYTSA